MTRQGHVPLDSSVRPEEADLVDELASELFEEATLIRRREHVPETMWAWNIDLTALKTRAGIVRASVRYVLEHREEFKTWVKEQNNR